VGSLLIFPVGQTVQFDAPLLCRVSVTEPGLHVSQLLSPDGLYLPAGQRLQCEAPAVTPLPSVSMSLLAVKLPAPHTEHLAVGSPLNFVSGHPVHVDAPLLTIPVSVPFSAMDPAAHTLHWPCAVFPWLPTYVPALHGVQGAVDLAEYQPAAQAIQLDAPLLTTVPAPFSVMEPAGQSWHAVEDTAVYRPAVHLMHVDAPAEARVFVTDPLGQAVQPEDAGPAE
jgi:hypothetical protein